MPDRRAGSQLYGALARSRARTRRDSASGGIVEDRLDVARELGRGPIEEAGVTENLAMLGDVVGDDRIARAHRLDQGRVGPADLGGLDVRRRVRPEDVVAVTIDRAEEADPRVGRAP